MKSKISIFLFAILFSAAGFGQAQSGDPPTRIARLAYLQGGVSFRPAGADEWVDPGLNRPLTVGDQLWSDRGGRVEMQLDGSNVRLGAETSAGILNLTDETTQIQLSSGSMIVHVQQLEDDESYEIDTPNVAFSILRPGTYRLTVAPDGQSTAIAVRSGQGEAVGGSGVGYTVRAGESEIFSGVETVDADNVAMLPQDEFDNWCAERDYRFEHSESARYVSSDVVGYEELDNQGNWNDTPEYGHVWFPTSVEASWAPYHEGHWAYIAPWGYTWVDDRNWGFAPFHYGRWVYWRQRWGWVPAPPRAPDVLYVRPVYAPALVAWVGAGATLAWFPLAPREVFVPSYPVSRRYLNVVNVSNTRINTTVINNYYNTTVINRTTINNVTYANRRVPGAVMATSSQDFANARPIRVNQGNFDRRAIADAPVRAFAPAVVPARAAVFGGRGIANVRPPQAVQTRVTEARMAPAPAAPGIDARLQALRDSRGRTPIPTQASRAPAQNAPPAANVRVVPPVRTLVNSQQLDRGRLPAPQSPPAGMGSAARAPVHAGELPSPARAPSPGVADSVLERQQLQEQQHLQASQEAQRQRVQQQQDAQDRRLSQQQSGDLRRQQLDQQRNAQSQAQAQAQAQAELQRNQQAQQRNAQVQQQAADQQRQNQAQAQQQHDAQLQRLQQQQAQEQQRQNQVQAQAQQQAEQQRAQQVQQQRQVEQQAQQQRASQLEQQQRAQQAEQQRQAQMQAQQQRNEQLERQRDQQQAQLQRQQQDAQRQQAEAQRQGRERQVEAQHQQQTEQLQQQQARAQQELQQRQQAAQQQQQQVRKPVPAPQRQQ